MSKDNNFTKSCIKQAFIFLISENEYKKITIADITNKAGINRTSFYKFYETKDALLEELKNNFYEKSYYYIENFEYAEDKKEYIIKLVKSVYEYKTFIIALRKAKLINSTELYNNKLRKLLYKKDNSFEEYRKIANVGAIIGIIIKWMENNFDLEPEKIVSLISKIVYNKD